MCYAQERYAPGLALVGGPSPSCIAIVLLPTADTVTDVGNLSLVDILGIPFIWQVENVRRRATRKGSRELLIHTTPGNHLMIHRYAWIGVGEFLQQRFPEIGFFLAMRRLPEKYSVTGRGGCCFTTSTGGGRAWHGTSRQGCYTHEGCGTLEELTS